MKRHAMIAIQLDALAGKLLDAVVQRSADPVIIATHAEFRPEIDELLTKTVGKRNPTVSAARLRQLQQASARVTNIIARARTGSNRQ